MPAKEPITRPPGRRPGTPISLRQIERVVSRSVAVFALVFAAQTVPWLLPQLDEADPAWLWIVITAIALGLVLCIVLSFAGVAVRASHGAVAIIYAIALVTWPLAILPGVEVFPGLHWLYYLINVGTATAAVAFPTLPALVYLIATPSVFLVIRTTEAGGGATWLLATLESVYTLILGSALLILVTMLRNAARSVDVAQQTALDRYALAVRHHALEVERARVDAIVHDSVLTTLLATARADTSEAKQLVATMAGNAIGHVRDATDASPGPEGAVRLTALADQIADVGVELGADAAFRVGGIGTRSVPADAAEALFSASVQAIVNSLHHAGEAERWVEVRGVPGGVEVVIGDAGRGFVLEDVPAERLGVRVSIQERLASVGGKSTIRTAPGEGTSVILRWPDPGE